MRYLLITTDTVTGEQTKEKIDHETMLNYPLIMKHDICLFHVIIEIESGKIVFANSGESFANHLHAKIIKEKLSKIL